METEETKQNEGEQQAASEREQANTASNKGAETSEAKGTETSKLNTGSPEFKHWQSQFDKSEKAHTAQIKTLQDQITQMASERQVADTRKREEVAEKDFDRQIDTEVAEGKLTEDRGEFLKDWRRKWREDFVTHQKAKQDFDTEKTKWEDTRKSETLYATIGKVQEEAEKQGKYFSYSDAKAIAEGSDGNSKLISIMVKSAPVAKDDDEEPERETKRPDSSLTAAGGDSDDAFLKRMSDPNHATTKEDLKRIAALQSKRG